MKEALFLAIAILLAGENPEPASLGSVSARYSTICENYRRAMANAQSQNALQEELRRIGVLRHEAFRTLIIAGLSEPEKMMAADWAALGMASEYLFQRDECIKYSFRAIELDPATKEAYVPLIRSLLNANRIDDAEAALASAEKHVNDGSNWHEMHYFLFVKYRGQKQWAKAASHFQTALETVLLEGGQNAIEVKSTVRKISEYLVTMQKAGLEEHGRLQLQTWSRTCADKLERLSNDDSAGDRELFHCAALCEVRCEIAKCLPELVYDDYLVLWAKTVYHPRWASCEIACPMQQAYLGKYVESNAAKVRSWSNVAAEFSQLLNDHFAVKSDERNEVSKSILLKLQDFAASRIASDSSGEVSVGP